MNTAGRKEDRKEDIGAHGFPCVDYRCTQNGDGKGEDFAVKVVKLNR